MTLLWLCVLAAVSMGLQDVAGTWCVIAEAQGRATKAGLWDAAGDAARLTTAAVSVGTVIQRGILDAAVVVAVVMVTSFVVTRWAVTHAHRVPS